MRKLSWSVLAAGVSALALSSAAAAAPTAYKVKPGDTLTELAERNDATVSELRALNPGLPKSGELKVGQRLKLPRSKGGGASASKRDARTHEVRSGETLSSIADRYDTTVAALKRLNPDLPTSGQVNAGSELVVSGARAGGRVARTETAGSARKHTVKSGETLSAIADKYDTTVGELKRLNPDLSGSGRVRAGETLVVAADDDHAASPAPSRATGKAKTHVVKRGETLSAIAGRYETSVSALKALNPDLPRNGRVQAGDRLVIAAPSDRGPSKAARATSHQVEAGDTLFGIAQTYGTTVAVLKDLNPGLPAGGKVRLGEKIRLPGAPEQATASAASTSGPERPATGAGYAVQDGDTLSGVSRRFGLTIGELQARNGLAPDTPLRAGQRLSLPAGAVDGGAAIYAMGPSPAGVRRAPTSSKPVEAGAGEPAGSTPSAPIAYQPSGPYVAPARPGGPAPSQVGQAPSASQPRGGQTPAQATRTTPPSPPRTPAVPVPATPFNTEAAVAAGQGRFQWPVRGQVVGRFGPAGAGLRNDGVDIAAANGDPVRAAAAGEVVYAGDSVPGFGNLVLVKHDGGWVTAYAHLGRINVRMREQVTQGAQVGTVGASGGLSAPQLHFETRFAPTPQDRARPIDPLTVLPGQ